MHRLTKEQALSAQAPQCDSMNRARLDEMTAVLQPWGMKNVLVVRDGRRQWEWSAGGCDRPGAVFSCTKSVLSVLIGIAIDSGLIRDEDVSIGEYFELSGSGKQRLRQIRIRHLLTMTPGLDWPDFDKPYRSMKQSDDWVRYVLDRPVAHAPGTAFTYNSGGSHLLAAILTQAAATDVLTFAREKLFGPLGIRQVKWNGYQGIREGGTGLHLAAGDLAKVGLLYACGGVWEGRRIVSADWIARSTAASSKGLANYRPPIYGAYGYHWWVAGGSPEGLPEYYFAFGYGGQYLVVCLALSLVVVLRKQPNGRNQAILSRRLLHEYIFPAAGVSSATLSGG